MTETFPSDPNHAGHDTGQEAYRSLAADQAESSNPETVPAAEIVELTVSRLAAARRELHSQGIWAVPDARELPAAPDFTDTHPHLTALIDASAEHAA